MRNLLDNLEEAGMNFNQVVSTSVYLDDLRDLATFDEVYAQYFGPVAPARTVVQQIAPTERTRDKEDHYPDLEQVSLIAVRTEQGNRLKSKNFDVPPPITRVKVRFLPLTKSF
jgi:enamine deaminase RidA (YjgF/YER057c/UK114 family)